MNVAVLDSISVNHTCWLKRCSVLARIMFVAAVLGLLLTTLSLPFMGGLALLLAALALLNRLPLKVLAPLVLTPMLFAGVFAVSLGNWAVGAAITVRAGLAALTVVSVFVTVPPLRLLGLLTAPLPEVFGELLYFTYRALFLLWESLDNTLTAVRLRRGNEGFSPARIRANAQVYGMTLLRAWDLAGRQYSLLRLRGLGSGLKLNRDWSLRWTDLVLLMLTVLIAAGWYYV